MKRLLILTGLCLVLSGCSVPLAPGYRVEKQFFEVRFQPAPEPHLLVHASFDLRNTGNRDLSSLEVVLPATAALGRRNLHVLVNGLESPPQSDADARAQSIEIPFHPPWAQKQRLALEIEYELAPGPPGTPLIAVKADSFHLRPFDWLPAPRPPENFLASGGDPPREFRLSVRVPSDFAVFASGREEKSRSSAGETEHRFRFGLTDFSPGIVAGKYAQSKTLAPAGEVIFASFRALDAPRVQRAAERLAATRAFYESAFGRTRKKPGPTRVMESRAHFRQSEGGHDRPTGFGFPGGALLNEHAFTLDISGEDFLDLAEHELAHTWFGQMLSPRPEAAVLFTEGLAEYAVTAAAEARGGEAARRRRIALLLRWYQESRNQVGEKNEKPLELLTTASPWEQRVFAYNKGAFFFLALEDEFGKENLRHALARMISSFRSGPASREAASVGFHELRAALEAESGKSAADFFRAWLFHPGIPQEFRARYAR